MYGPGDQNAPLILFTIVLIGALIIIALVGCSPPTEPCEPEVFEVSVDWNSDGQIDDVFADTLRACPGR